jgi:ABC-type multidrug transport system ATPase subunit
LNALAGQTQKAKNVKLVGRLLINGKESSNVKQHKVAYVRQDDIFYSQLTVSELQIDCGM